MHGVRGPVVLVAGAHCFMHAVGECILSLTSSPRVPAASVSLGMPREFLLRSNADHGNKYRFRLGGGALLVMSGSVQEGWMHSVPRRAALTGERISLTFRRIVLREQER